MTPNEPLQLLREYIRADMVAIVLGVLLAAAGIAGMLAAALRARMRDLQLISFGAFSLIYGVRLLATTGIVQVGFDVPESVWRTIISICTFVILVPGLVFWLALFERRKAGVLAWMIAMLVALSTTEIALYFAGHSALAMRINNIAALFLAAFAVAVVAYRIVVQRERSRSWKVLGAMTAVLMSAVVYENIASMGLVPYRKGMEPVVFFFFNLALGYVAVDHVFSGERRLIAIESELATARRIQQSILPKGMPEVEGLRIAAVYEPMTSVAGDFYDFVSAGEKQVGVLVADVSGHGIGAALIASMVKVSLATLAHEAHDPAAVLKGMNDVLCRQGLQGQFVTAAFVFLDMEVNVVRYAGAAHPAIVIFDTSGEHRAAENNGLPLGLMPWAEYKNVELQIASGERMLIFTDGIQEAAGGAEEEFFGEKNFPKFIAENATLSPESFTTRLVTAVQAWAATGPEKSQQDDLTVVVVERR